MKRLLPLLLLAACTNQPREDYDDFRDRTAAERERTERETAESSLQDLTGRWMMHALLPGGIDLGLIVDFAPQGELEDGVIPTTYTADIWLWRQDVPPIACDAQNVCPNGRTCNRFGTCESPPLVTTTTQVSPEGVFEVVADPLFLPKEILNTESPVEARVIIKGKSTDPDTWCGAAEGSAISPIMLNLAGSTHSAFRHSPLDWACAIDDRECTAEEAANHLNYEFLYLREPFRCPPSEDDPPPPDMGVEPDGGPVRPESPDLSNVASAARDITGNYIFSGRVNGAIPLSLWLTVIYTAGPNGANLDGALRSAMAEPGSEALATFSTTVDANGFFEVWLPDLNVSTDLATVNADILLAAATLPDGFCGIAAGTVNSPPLGELNEMTTFFATPWDPTTELPEDPLNACPE